MTNGSVVEVFTVQPVWRIYQRPGYQQTIIIISLQPTLTIPFTGITITFSESICSTGGMFNSPNESGHIPATNANAASPATDARNVAHRHGPVEALSLVDRPCDEPNQRRKADREAEHPDETDKELRAAHGHDAGVLHWTGHGDVAVEGDGAQVQDGSGAHPHIHGEPAFAPETAEDPHL